MVYMFKCTCSHVCEYTCVVSPKLMPSVFLSLSPTMYIEAGSLLNLELFHLGSLAILLLEGVVLLE